LIARAEMARLLRAIVVRFERPVPSVCEALRDLLNLWREVEQLVNIDDRILPPNRKERPIMKPGVAVTSVDKTLDLRGGKRTLNAESTISEKPHNKRFFALCVCHVILLDFEILCATHASTLQNVVAHVQFGEMKSLLNCSFADILQDIDWRDSSII
jgi:hypothetical protein